MKKISIAIFLIFNSILSVSAQTTYTWKGATGGSYATASNWSPTRTTPASTDILVFDGFTGTVSMAAFTGETVNQLIFKNASQVIFSGTPANTTSVGTIARAAVVTLASATTTSASPVVTTSTTSSIYPGAFVTAGTGMITLGSNYVTSVSAGSSFTTASAATANGSSIANIAISQPIAGFTNMPAVGDFIFTGTASNFEQITSTIDAATAFGQNTGAITSAAGYKVTAVLNISGTGGLLSIESGSAFVMSCTTPFIIKLNSGAIGTVYGSLAYGSAADRVIVDNGGTAKLTFKNGSLFDTGSATGSPFGSVTNATNDCVVFEYNATYKASGSPTANSPNACFGSNSGTSVIAFQKGSIYYHNTTYAMAGFTHRAYPNVVWASTSTTVSIPSTTPMDTVTVNAGTTIAPVSNSYFIIKGDLINNGTIDNTGKTPVYVFCGSVPQNISGTGTFAGNGLCKVFIAPNSTVNLGTNLVQNGGGYTYNYGILNFGTYSISNTNAYATATTVLKGQAANTVSAISTTGVVYAGAPYVMNVTSLTGFVQGVELIDSTGGLPVPANTIVTYPSGLQLNLSNPLPAGTYIVKAKYKTDGSTFITANANGLQGSYPLPTNGVFTANTSPGCNYTFNTATATPFSLGLTSLNTYNVTLAAPISSNLPTWTVNNTLNIGGNMLTIPTSDTLKITSGNAVVNSSSSAYISLGVNTATGTHGLLRMGGIKTATTFPVGANGYYLPVTITPVGTAEDYSVSVFNGATVDATPNGTAIASAQKATVVDAVWNVTSNFTVAGTPSIQLGWPTALEGASFAGYANNQIGIAQYSSGWGVYAGSGDNTANTATNSFGSFGAFSVGFIGSSLPVKFSNISASFVNNQSNISWQLLTEINVDKYVVESSTNGVNFSEIGFVNASNAGSYAFTDLNPEQGVNYYRIKAVDKSGAITFSSVVQLNNSGKIVASVQVYPNPVVNKTLNISLSNLSTDNYSVKVINVAGQLCLTKSVAITNNASTALSIALPNSLVAGMYHIVISSASQQFVKDILVK